MSPFIQFDLLYHKLRYKETVYFKNLAYKRPRKFFLSLGASVGPLLVLCIFVRFLLDYRNWRHWLMDALPRRVVWQFH